LDRNKEWAVKKEQNKLMYVEEKYTKRRNICLVPEAGNITGAVSSKALSIVVRQPPVGVGFLYQVPRSHSDTPHRGRTRLDE